MITIGDGIGDIVDDYSDFLLFWISIGRGIRNQYRKVKRSIRAAFEKQTDEEVMQILQRENEAYILTHMGVGINEIQYVEPLESS